jgi:hypothetical protein
MRHGAPAITHRIQRRAYPGRSGNSAGRQCGPMSDSRARVRPFPWHPATSSGRVAAPGPVASIRSLTGASVTFVEARQLRPVAIYPGNRRMTRRDHLQVKSARRLDPLSGSVPTGSIASDGVLKKQSDRLPPGNSSRSGERDCPCGRGQETHGVSPARAQRGRKMVPCVHPAHRPHRKGHRICRAAKLPPVRPGPKPPPSARPAAGPGA